MTPEHTDPHGECAAEIARLKAQIAVMRDALRDSIDTMEEQCARFDRLGKHHNELETTIGIAQSALSHPALEGKT